MGAFGAYGKMPSLGDFFRIGLPRSFCEPWDAWLQQVLVHGKAAMGNEWSDAYLSAPIWRFSAASGQVEPAPVAGIVMPSVDRVGRRFPLTLAAEGTGATADTFAALEDIALAALEDDMTKDRLSAALSDLSAMAPAAAAQRGVTWQALWGEGVLEFVTNGLPKGAEALRLYDLSLWPEATDSMDARA